VREQSHTHAEMQLAFSPAAITAVKCGTDCILCPARVAPKGLSLARSALMAARTDTQSNHGATILIAEDDEPLRDLLRRLLHAEGYQVLIAADGKKALEIAGQHTGKIDLLLSDVVMPEMSGVELAKALKARRPESRIMLTSAYPNGMFIVDSGWHFIQKPYFPRRLLEEVQKAMSIPPEKFRPEDHE
jgi:CheY-like chemotaxis protein